METIIEKAYRLADSGDQKSALAVILNETEKLLSINLKCVAEQFARSIDVERVWICKNAYRFTMLIDSGGGTDD